MNAIEVRGLSKAFGGHLVFEGLDLHVRRGEIVALLGPSGCGKSTILRCLAGLLQGDGGWIRVDGEVGVVFQEPRLFGWLDVAKNVAFGARDAAERERVGELLGLVGLSGAASRLPKELSGGMAQRTALARTLVRNPSILLLDEPLAALDAIKRYELQRELRAIIEQKGLTSLIVTHDVDEAVALADRVIVLGGSPATVTAQITSAERDAVLDALGFREERRRTSRPPRVFGGTH